MTYPHPRRSCRALPTRSLLLAAIAVLALGGCAARTPFPEGDLVVDNPDDLFHSSGAAIAAQLENSITARLRQRNEGVRFGRAGGLIRVVLVKDESQTDESYLAGGITFRRTLTALVTIDGRAESITVARSSSPALGEHGGEGVIPPSHQSVLLELADEIADRISGAQLSSDWRN